MSGCEIRFDGLLFESRNRNENLRRIARIRNLKCDGKGWAFGYSFGFSLDRIFRFLGLGYKTYSDIKKFGAGFGSGFVRFELGSTIGLKPADIRNVFEFGLGSGIFGFLI